MLTAVRIHSALALVSLALLTGACDDQAAEPWGGQFRDCPTCGVTNSPRVNDYEFPQLNLDRQANDDGVILHGIVSPTNIAYTLDVADDDFVARDTQGNVVAMRDALIDWQIWLELPGSVHRYVKIYNYVREIPSWATGAEPISGYALGYIDPGSGKPVNVCPDSGTAVDASVTLIGGETYDRELKLVEPNRPRWFTVACRDEATYKMKRMNYGPNDLFNGTNFPATVAQRQATIKMITADYCGTGDPYTVQGTAVYWRNVSNTVNNHPIIINPSNPPSLEAFWDENGALCLSDRRYVSPDDVDCNLPACPNSYPGAYEWRTKVP